MWSSTPRVLFPKKDFDNAASALYATQELLDPSTSVITYFPANKNYEGKSVSEIAALNKETDAQALMRIVREEDGKGAAIAGASMLEDDVMNFFELELYQCMFRWSGRWPSTRVRRFYTCTGQVCAGKEINAFGDGCL